MKHTRRTTPASHPFTDVVAVNDETVCPFPGALMYLFVSEDYGATKTAHALADHTVIDLPALISAAIGRDVDTGDACDGPNYAALITDDRAPADSVVWQSADFYLLD